MVPIHVASIQVKRKSVYLILKKQHDHLFQWLEVDETFTQEKTTHCTAETIPLAIQKAVKQWRENAFRLVHCGFRYTLPARDVVGCTALFWQMSKSYEAYNSQYFDSEVGHLCYVDFASQEAIEIWSKIRGTNVRAL